MRRLVQGLTIAFGLAATASGAALAQEPPPSPPDVVAQVGADAIAKPELEKWFAQASRSRFGRSVELLPPRYVQCVAVQRVRRAARGWRKLGVRALRKRCRQDHRALRREVLTFLVQARWIEQEAELLGVEVSAVRVDRTFRRQRRQAFPTDRAYRRFLRKSGTTESDIKFRVRLDILQGEITKLVLSNVAPVTRRDVARYRASHRKKLAGMRPAKAKRKVRALLVSRREQHALGRFIADFRKRNVAITWCAPGHRIPECGASAPG